MRRNYVPITSTVRRRLKALSVADTATSRPRSTPKQARCTRSCRRPSPDSGAGYDTPMDLIVVDLIDREPIGLARRDRDRYIHRRIAGFHVTGGAVSDVRWPVTMSRWSNAPWLSMREVKAIWPVQGKPTRGGRRQRVPPNSIPRRVRPRSTYGIAIDRRPPGRS